MFMEGSLIFIYLTTKSACGAIFFEIMILTETHLLRLNLIKIGLIFMFWVFWNHVVLDGDSGVLRRVTCAVAETVALIPQKIFQESEIRKILSRVIALFSIFSALNLWLLLSCLGGGRDCWLRILRDLILQPSWQLFYPMDRDKQRTTSLRLKKKSPRFVSPFSFYYLTFYRQVSVNIELILIDKDSGIECIRSYLLDEIIGGFTDSR